MRSFACVLEVDQHPETALKLATLAVFNVHKVIVDAYLGLRSLLQWSLDDAVQRYQSLPDFVLAALDLVQSLHLQGVLGEDLGQFVLCRLKVKGAEAIAQLRILYLGLAHTCWWRRLEVVYLPQLQLVRQNKVGGHLEVADAQKVNG